LRYACVWIATLAVLVLGDLFPAAAQVGPGIYDDRSSVVVYSGTWGQNTNSGDYDGTHSYSNTTGSTASLTFTGTQVSYVYSLNSNRGYAQISIDGSVVTAQLDAYSATWISQKLATYSGLSNGTHTITVAYTGKSDSQATANYVTLDAFIVGISFDDTNPTVTYTAGWGTAVITGDWDGSHHSTDVAGSANFVFAGTFVTYVFSTNTNRGYASISIDGVSQGTVDQYAPITEPQVSKSFSGLSAGIHTITISWTGQQDSGSSGTYVAVDAFITAESLYSPNVPAQEYIRFGGNVIAIENAGP
jgi:hypothetical protein